MQISNSVVGHAHPPRVDEHAFPLTGFSCGLAQLHATVLSLLSWPSMLRCIHVHVCVYEPLHKKTNNLHMRKQRRRSASQ